MTELEDEFGPYLAQALTDPVFRGHYDDAGVRFQLRDTLIARRHAARVSRAEIARRMEVTEADVDRFEREGVDPRLSMLQRYARALGVRISIGIEEPA